MARQRGGPRPMRGPPIPPTVQQIVAQIRAAQLAQANAPNVWDWSYRCVYTDLDTEEVVGGQNITVSTASATNYQEASSIARQIAAVRMPYKTTPPVTGVGNIRVNCRRTGSIVGRYVPGGLPNATHP